MFSDNQPRGTVSFIESVDKLQKKNVRGLLRKRAKKYDSDSDGDH